MRSVVLLMAAAAMSGCVMMGGSKIVDVQGALPASAGECLLDLVVADTARVKLTQPVQGNFRAGVVLSDGIAQRYYFVARCAEDRTFRSETIRIGMSDRAIKVDLVPEDD